MDCLEPQIADFYNQEPSMVKCIEGMNKELEDAEQSRDIERENNRLLRVDNEDMANAEEKSEYYQWGIRDDYIETRGPNSSNAFGRSSLQNQREILQQIIECMNDDDWNGDGGQLKLQMDEWGGGSNIMIVSD